MNGALRHADKVLVLLIRNMGRKWERVTVKNGPAEPTAVWVGHVSVRDLSGVTFGGDVFVGDCSQ